MNNTVLPTVDEVKKDPKRALAAILPILIELDRLNESGEINCDEIMDALLEENPEWEEALDAIFGIDPVYEGKVIKPSEEFLNHADDYPEPHMD